MTLRDHSLCKADDPESTVPSALHDHEGRLDMSCVVNMMEGRLEVKLPTDGKTEVGRVREIREEEQKREDQRRERVRRKKMQVCEKVGKPRFTAFFQ